LAFAHTKFFLAANIMLDASSNPAKSGGLDEPNFIAVPVLCPPFFFGVVLDRDEITDPGLNIWNSEST